MDPKCERYWPEKGSELEVGDLSVTLEAETKVKEVASLTRRRIRISRGVGERRENKEEAEEAQEFEQFHLTSWPDFGVTDSPRPLVRLVGMVRGAGPPPPGNILVHCSAGVGRTGTFISLYRLTEEVDKKWNGSGGSDSGGNGETLDVFKTVLALRRDRGQMVRKAKLFDL